MWKCKRRIYFILLIMFSMILQMGCSKDEQMNIIDWEETIRKDCFDSNSNVEEVIEEVVSFEVKQNESQLIVTVDAPNICNELLNWMESVSDEDFTEEEMEQEILRLLKETESTKAEYILPYSINDENIEITYTTEFSEAMTCGLTQFYAEAMQQILNGM